jgi:hypothetical protein
LKKLLSANRKQGWLHGLWTERALVIQIYHNGYKK